MSTPLHQNVFWRMVWSFALLANFGQAIAKPPFAYVVNLSSNDISAYVVDAATGAPTSVTGSPFAAGYEPVSIAVTPSGKFAYVVNRGTNDISAYAIDANTGALTQVSGSPFKTVTGPLSVAVAATSSGEFAYVVGQGNSNIYAYVIDPTTGVLARARGSPFATGATTWRIAVSPNGAFVYVTLGSTVGAPPSIAAYSVNTQTGALKAVAGSPFGTNAIGIDEIAVSPTGAFVYLKGVVNSATGRTYGVWGYIINAATGALTLVPGSPFATGTGPIGVAIAPSGRFIYLANYEQPYGILGYAVHPTSGALTSIAGSPFAALSRPSHIAFARNEAFAYVTNTSLNSISVYAIDAASGALAMTSATRIQTGIGPWSLATRDDPSFLIFPLDLQTPETATVNSVMDHSATFQSNSPHFYTHDTNGVVTAYTGEQGKRDCGLKTCVLSATDPSYLKARSDARINGGLFTVNGTYSGAGYPTYLSYDGHPGFDYQVSGTGTTPIFAPADGQAYVPENDRITREDVSVNAVTIFNIMAIDHLNGYSTWYLHMGNDATGYNYRRINCQDGTPEIELKPGDPPVAVRRGCRIGFAGDKGVPGVPHLHFEVRRGVTTDPVTQVRTCARPTCYPVDPYGWAPIPSAPLQIDPYPAYPNGKRLWVIPQ